MRSVPTAVVLLMAAARVIEPQAAISGVVFDSLAMRPLGGATVQLVHRREPWNSRSVSADSSGNFRFDRTEPGEYLLGFQDARLVDFELAPPVALVTISDAQPLRVMLAIPSAATVARLQCGSLPPGTGFWMGRLRSAVTGNVIAGAEVAASWYHVQAIEKRIVREARTVLDSTDAGGLFRLCELPLGEFVHARAAAGADSSGVVTATLESGPLLVRDLYAAPSLLKPLIVRPDSSTADTTALVVDIPTGNGMLRGQVLTSRGAPVGHARVRLFDTGREVTANDAGFFLLDSLPLGSRIVDARAVGFSSALQQVDLLAGDMANATFVLDPIKALLDTVKITAERLVDTQWHTDFLARRKRQSGTFLDSDEIDRRNPLYATDLVRMAVGVTVTPGSFGGSVWMRALGGGSCNPDVYLDGFYLVATRGEIDDLVSAYDIRAIEVYTRPEQVPIEFQRMSGCGAVVIWTGPRVQWRLSR